jgi:hypoxanthine phosphoribosyltransferase
MNGININEDVEKVLISEEEIEKCLVRLASEIEQTYRNMTHKLVLVCVMKGSLVFVADLMRKINLPLEIDFISVSSYGCSTVTSGCVTVKCDLSRSDISDCNILVVEDILDTGNTLSWLLKHLKERGAHSVKLCTLLNKPERRTIEVPVDFEGFQIPDEFAIGYGLDYNEKYRNIPYIGVLKKEIYSNP